MAVYGTLTIDVSIDVNSVEEANSKLHDLLISLIRPICEKDNGEIVELDYHHHKLKWIGKSEDDK